MCGRKVSPAHIVAQSSRLANLQMLHELHPGLLLARDVHERCARVYVWLLLDTSLCERPHSYQTIWIRLL